MKKPLDIAKITKVLRNGFALLPEDVTNTHLKYRNPAGYILVRRETEEHAWSSVSFILYPAAMPTTLKGVDVWTQESGNVIAGAKWLRTYLKEKGK